MPYMPAEENDYGRSEKLSYPELEKKVKDLEGKAHTISRYEELFTSLFTCLSHELRTNLNAVVSFSYLLGNNDVNEQERIEFNKYISDSCDNLLMLFDNVLDSFLLETGKFKFYPRDINLQGVFDELQAEFTDILEKQDKRDLKMVLVSPGPSGETVYTDETRLVKHLKNLFYNALKHTDKGKIRFGYQANNTEMRFFMSDTGNGFRENRRILNQKNLSDGYYKSSEDFGSLGLINTKRIVEMQGGKLTLGRNGPDGSDIRVCLPLAKPASAFHRIREKILKNKVAL